MKRVSSTQSNVAVAEPEIQNDESLNLAKSARLGQCEVCAANDARYTCPKCEVKTCCLTCVQIHKKELECNGIRDRTKYIPLRQMTNMDFRNDYYFLEECVRYTQDRKRDPIKQFTHYNKMLPPVMFRLRKTADARGTKLRFLLQHFTRRKLNTTYCDWKQNKIYWRIEWIFLNAQNVKYVDERCDEELTLQELLDKYVNTNPNSVPKKQLLVNYQEPNQLQLLLKAEGIKRNRTRFYNLDASKTLRENLAQKTIVEYPIIYVSCERLKSDFEIIDNDYDVEKETKAYEAALEDIKKKQCAASWEALQVKPTSENINEENVIQQKSIKNIQLQSSEEIIKQSNNFLFTDERLLDALSSDDDGNETEEEKN